MRIALPECPLRLRPTMSLELASPFGCRGDFEFSSSRAVSMVAQHSTTTFARTCSSLPVAGQRIRSLATVNGVRVTVEDGTWGLVRASSNKPELVVVVESPASEARMRAMFEAVDRVLRENPEVGAYNQTI